MTTDSHASETTIDGLARLRVELASSGPEALELSVSLTNLSGGELALFNRLSRPGDPKHTPRKDVVYSYFQDKTLVLCHWIPPRPRGADISLPVVPGLTRVAAGSRFEERVKVPLPVQVGDAYQPIRDKLQYGFDATLHDTRREAKRVVYRLGLMPVDNPKALYPVGDPSDGIQATSSPGLAEAAHKVISSEAFSLTVPVIVKAP
jgi:hypothetical protein